MAYAIKAEIGDARARSFAFQAQKTMYGGRHIAPGDPIYLFASENEGGAGLAARGIVTSAAVTPRAPGVARQTPRVSIAVERTALAKRPLGRDQLRRLTDWNDGARALARSAWIPTRTATNIANAPERRSRAITTTVSQPAIVSA